MNPDNPVPLLDLTRYDEELKRAIACGVEGVFSSGRFILGAVNTEFEKAFADRIGVRHALGVSSGTDALLVALMALGVGPGDEVITSPFSFFASAGVVSRLGGRPVFVDIEPDTFNVNADRLSAAITPRTKVIMPVHLYGQCADMDTIQEISGEIPIVEDACQAVGATQQRRTAGAMGKMGAFSFYPTKNLGGCGEGGLVTTARQVIADRVRRLRDHGQSEKYVHAEEGYNGRLDALQAAILRVKLRRLAGWNARRRALAAQYTERLKGMGLAGASGDAAARLRLPVEKSWGAHVFHQYTVRLSADRDRLRAALLEKGIETGVHYPIPLHLQPCYAWMGLREGSFPVAERAAREVLSLPLYPEMTDAQVERVCEALRDVLGRG